MLWVPSNVWAVETCFPTIGRRNVYMGIITVPFNEAESLY